MSEADTIPVKYVYTDVANFTQGRTVEAQSEIVIALNRIVLESLQSASILDAKRILIPTGDGICICLLNIDDPYDIHIRIATDLLSRLHTHNQATDPSRQFKVRIGINANSDNLITDVNGNRNLAGAGINTAQRIMDRADGNQIMVGALVYGVLRQREKYVDKFRPYTATVKHAQAIDLYQFLDSQVSGLDIGVPSQFVQPAKPQAKMTRISAYYMAHAKRHRKSLARLAQKVTGEDAATIFLWFLAQDSDSFAQSTDSDPFRPKVDKSKVRDFDGGVTYYNSSDFWVTCELAESIRYDLRGMGDCLEDSWGTCLFLTPAGEKRLKSEHPDIWKEFGFEP